MRMYRGFFVPRQTEGGVGGSISQYSRTDWDREKFLRFMKRKEVMETASFIPRETEDSLRKEGLLRSRIEKSWGIKMEKLPTTYSLDYAMKKGEEVKGFIELKCRTHTYGTFDAYMISLKKWNACREIHATSNLKTFLGVGFLDGDYWLDTADVLEFSVMMGGRSDREWTVDREPCVFFDIKYFKKFK